VNVASIESEHHHCKNHLSILQSCSCDHFAVALAKESRSFHKLHLLKSVFRFKVAIENLRPNESK
jgi:hypothetical protein